MKRQRGGTILGFIIGVLVGLGAALAVAVYVTKVPVPFMNRGQSRTAEQDVEEAKKNKDWDPNAPLYGKNPAKSASPAAVAASASAPSAAPAVAPVPAAASAAAPAVAPPAFKADDKKPADTKSADPLGDLAKAKAGSSDVEPYIYWVQLGAYKTAEDAESLHAKLALSGIETTVSEREQSGHVIHRVRMGPFDTKIDGEKVKAKMDKAGFEAVLVRVQR